MYMNMMATVVRIDHMDDDSILAVGMKLGRNGFRYITADMGGKLIIVDQELSTSTLMDDAIIAITEGDRVYSDHSFLVNLDTRTITNENTGLTVTVVSYEDLP